jgi:hypothetical protein
MIEEHSGLGNFAQNVEAGTGSSWRCGKNPRAVRIGAAKQVFRASDQQPRPTGVYMRVIAG